MVTMVMPLHCTTLTIITDAMTARNLTLKPDTEWEVQQEKIGSHSYTHLFNMQLKDERLHVTINNLQTSFFILSDPYIWMW